MWLFKMEKETDIFRKHCSVEVRTKNTFWGKTNYSNLHRLGYLVVGDCWRNFSNHTNIFAIHFSTDIRIFKISEWPSGLRRCNQNRKVPGSNPTRCSAGLRDLTSLQGSQWPSGRTCTNAVINIELVRLSPWEWPKVGHGAAK